MAAGPSSAAPVERPWPDRVAVGLLAVVSMVAAFTFRDYGLGWDDFTHAQYGELLLSLYTSGLQDTRALSFVNLYLYGGGFDLASAIAAKISPFELFETRRLVAAVIGLSGLVVTWRIGRRVGGPLAGLVALVLLATCPLYFGHMFINPKDAPFAVAMALFLLGLVRAIDEYPLRESAQYQDVVGRLRSGVSIDEATRALTEAGRTAANRSATPIALIRLTPLIDEASDHFNPYQIALLSGAAGLLLLLACVNVAGLVLARGFTRQPELAVRVSMGAGRFRLIRQLLTETAVLSIAGGIAGAVIAALVMKPVFDNVSGLVPENARATVNLSVLAVTAAVALLSGLVVGLVPALRLSRVRIGAALSRASRTQGAPLSRRGGQVLIASEVALTIVVVAGAALLVRSYLRMASVDAGFDPGAIVTMDVTPLDQDDDATVKAFYPAVLAAVRAQPEVAAAGLCDCFKRNFGDRVVAAGGTDPIRLTSRGITPGVLEALDVRLRMGRLPTDRDLAVTPTPVVLSESAARRLFAERSPLGERVQIARAKREVIGVVTDVNFQAPFATDRPEVFYVSAEAHPVYTSIVVRPRADAPNLVARLRDAVQSTGTRTVIDAIRTGRERPDERVQMAGQRTFLAGLLAALSGTLAFVGVFGMTTFAAARRVREIGVRMALGATPGRIVRDIVGESALPAAIGLVIGLAGAALSTRVLASFLFNTSPTDATTFAAVTILLSLGACFAAWLPALRAARVDPAKALAAE